MAQSRGLEAPREYYIKKKKKEEEKPIQVSPVSEPTPDRLKTALREQPAELATIRNRHPKALPPTPEEEILIDNAYNKYNRYQEVRTLPEGTLTQSPGLLEDTKAQWEQAKTQLIEYRAGETIALREATADLQRLVTKFPPELLQESPYSSIYLMAAERNNPGIIDGVAEALPWLKLLHGQNLYTKMATTGANDKMRARFDKWSRQAQGTFVATVPSVEYEGDVGVAAGRTLEELAEQLRGQEFDKLVWTVDADWAATNATQFSFLFSQAQAQYPELKVDFTVNRPTEEGIEAAEEDQRRREEEDRGFFGFAISTLLLSLDTILSPISFGARYIGEGVREVQEAFGGKENRIPSPVEVYRDVVPAIVRHLPDAVLGNITPEEMKKHLEADELRAGAVFGEQLARLSGFEPTDPSFRSASNWFSLVGDFILTAGIGGFSRATRIAARTPFGETLTAAGKVVTRKEAIKAASLNPITRARLSRIGMEPEVWLRETVGGDEFLKTMWNMKEELARSGESVDQIAARIVERLGTSRMTIEDATFIARAKSVDEIAEIAAVGMRGGGTSRAIRASIRKELDDVEALIQGAPSGQVTDLLARREWLKLRQSRPERASVIQEFPSLRFIRDATRGYNTGRTAQTLRWMAEGIVRVPAGRLLTGRELRLFRVGRLFDQLPEGDIISPFTAANREDAFRKGFQTLDNLMIRAGVDDATKTKVLGKWIGMKGPDNLFEVMEDLGEAIKYGKNIDPMVADQLATFFHNTAEGATRGITDEVITTLDGRTVVNPKATIVDATTGQILPGVPTELIGRIPMPTFQELADASSFTQAILRRIPGGKGLKAAQHALSAFTVSWKRAILGARLVLALPLRIQGEQILRAAAYDVATVVTHPIQWLKAVRGTGKFAPFVDDVDEFLGTIIKNYGDEYRLVTGRGTTTVRKIYKYQEGRRVYNVPYFRAWADKLYFRSSDPVYRVLAAEGPKATLKWLNNPNTGGRWLRTMDNVLERANMTPEQWVNRLEEELQTITRGSTDIRQAIARGKISNADMADLVPMNTPDAVRPSMRNLLRERNDILRSIEAGRVTRRDVIKELNRIDSELRTTELLGTKAAKLNETGDVANILEAQVRDGRITPVPEVAGDVLKAEVGLRQVAQTGHPVRTVVDDLFRRFYSTPDLVISRRPTARFLANREYQRLRGLGMEPGVAKEAAIRNMAHKTSDMFYDLSARTSGQFWARNMSPFFPAWQEVVTTWAYRIPAQLGGVGLGHAILVNRANDIINVLKEVGIVQPNVYGQDSIIIPGLGNVISGLTGTDQKFDASFTLEGLNFATGLFSLGPLHGIALGEMSQHMEVLEPLADLFLRYGTEISAGPASFNRIWAAFLGSPPDFEFASKDYNDVLYERSVEDGIGLTMMRMGPPPVAPQRLQTLSAKVSLEEGEELTEDLAKQYLSPAEFEEYQTLVKQFRTDSYNYMQALIAGGERYARVIYGIRGAASVLLPSALTITPEFLKEKTELWEQIERVGKNSPQAQVLFDEFVAENPDMSWALVSKVRPVPGVEASTLPDFATDDEKMRTYYMDIVNGKLDQISRDDFAMLTMAVESFRLYQRRRQQITESYGSPVAILNDLFGYYDKQADYAEEWALFKLINPEASGLEEQIRFDKKLGKDIPVNTLAESRLEEVRYNLRALSSFFVVDGTGAQDMDFRAIMSTISDVLGPGEYGEPSTPIEKGLAWWWSDVGRPYFEKRQELIDKALDAENSGPLWDQVRVFTNEQPHMKGPDGKLYPTPEEVVWGMLSPVDQRAKEIYLSTKRLEWLTEYERDVLGWVGTTPKAEKAVRAFMENYNAGYRKISDIKEARNLHSSSSEWTSLKEGFETQMAQAAREGGKEVQFFYQWLEQPVAEKLTVQGVMTGSSWEKANNLARVMRGQIEAEGNTAGGGSQLALQKYDEFTTVANRLYKEDEEFAKQVDELDAAYENDRLTRSEVYEVVFFGAYPAVVKLR